MTHDLAKAARALLDTITPGLSTRGIPVALVHNLNAALLAHSSAQARGESQAVAWGVRQVRTGIIVAAEITKDAAVERAADLTRTLQEAFSTDGHGIPLYTHPTPPPGGVVPGLDVPRLPEHRVPAGFESVEAYRNAETGVVVVLGAPDADHSCDEMGCGSVGPHVVARGRLASPHPTPAPSPSAGEVPKAIAEAIGRYGQACTECASNEAGPEDFREQESAALALDAAILRAITPAPSPSGDGVYFTPANEAERAYFAQILAERAELESLRELRHTLRLNAARQPSATLGDFVADPATKAWSLASEASAAKGGSDASR